MTWNRESFALDRARRLNLQQEDPKLAAVAKTFLRESYSSDYCYQWDWAGFPILQMPEDIVAYQELMFRCKPSVVVETGVAWGGGIALLASIMSLYNPNGKVLGIDLNLDPSLQSRIDGLNLPVSIKLHKNDSTAPSAVEWVQECIEEPDTVMVILDSHHTHDHVLGELNMYAPIVSPGQFLIVGDTSVADLADATDRIRPWTSTNNPHSALEVFLENHPDFARDKATNSKLLTSFHPGGYLLKRL